MLSMSNISAAQAGSYYEKDGYYARLDASDNQWQGSLKEELGLSDNVEKSEFEALVNVRKERAGIDLCFSAPKSVSVAMCTDEKLRSEIIDAHNAAVSATLDKIEQREIGARITPERHAKQVHVKTGNMICGKFNHYVSRNSDPQLHTHCVIMNQTLYKGKLYAIDNPDLYKNKMLYGQIYRNELANQLLQHGIDIERTDLQKGFFELKGIEEKTLEKFSSRRAEIVEKLKEWGTNTPEAASRAAVMTRAAKEHKNLQELTHSWKESINEIGGVQIERAAGPIIRTDEEKQQDFSQGVERLARREYAFTEKDLKKSVLAAGVGSGLTEKDFDRLLSQNRELVPPIGRRIDKPGEEKYYSTAKNIATEACIINETAKGKGAMTGIGRDQIHAFLQTIENPQKSLSDQQREAVLKIVESKDRYFALQGLAGTGKTYGLQYAREILEHEGYTVSGAALAGKAAHGLETDSGIKSGTLHSFLNKLEREAGHADPAEDLQQKNEWNFAGLRPGAQKEAWIIDESSMIDNQTMKNLMDAAAARNAKVVFVGDDKQLLPVGVGNAYGNMVQTGAIDHIVIDEIRRQKENPELLEAVKQAAQGDIEKSFAAQNITEIARPSDRARAIVAEYTALTPEQQTGTIILTADNKTRHRINDQIRAELQKKGELPTGREYTLQDRTGRNVQKELAEGDKIIFLANDKRAGVMNGQTATIDRIDGHKLTVTSDEKPLEIDLNQYKKIDHGYAMTGHKAQGITTDRVLISLDSNQSQMNHRNAFYVDISRARSDVKIYCDDKAKIQEQVKDFAHKLTSRDFENPAKETERLKAPTQTPKIDTLTGAQLKDYCSDRAKEYAQQAGTVQSQIDEIGQKDIADVRLQYEAAAPQRMDERLTEIKQMKAQYRMNCEKHEANTPGFLTGNAARRVWNDNCDVLNSRRAEIAAKVEQYKEFQRDPAAELKDAIKPYYGGQSDRITTEAVARTAARPEIKELKQQRSGLEQSTAKMRIMARDFGKVPDQTFDISKGQSLSEVAKQIKTPGLSLDISRGPSRGGMER